MAWKIIAKNGHLLNYLEQKYFKVDIFAIIFAREFLAKAT